MKTVYMASFDRLVCSCDKAFSCPRETTVEVRELEDILRTLNDYPCLVLTDLKAVQLS